MILSMSAPYDTLIIGAGLSGLAAGIRLAHFGKKVCILEAHAVPGGLNSYYRRGQRCFDVGLHAMTNFVPKGARGAPLTKLLKQLRIPYDALELAEQIRCRIVFPGAALTFTNDFSCLREEVAREFPRAVDGFDKLAAQINDYDEISLDAPADLSARRELGRFISDPLLKEMLLCPLMYYGNAQEDDMDFTQFAVMWKSIFLQGFARPRQGMRHVIRLLLDRYAESGGELRLSCPVTRLACEHGRVQAVRIKNGETLTAEMILSSAGRVETSGLCSGQSEAAPANDLGRLSFVELIACLDAEPRTLGIEDTIVFFSATDAFAYRRPEDLYDLKSGVLCCPNNFRYDGENLEEGVVRVTLQASYESWERVAGPDPRRAEAGARARYRTRKEETRAAMLEIAAQYLPDFRAHVTYTDLFTPLTIRRYTGHPTGAVYGSPVKSRKGLTPYENLFLIGTDQGFLGIVGSMLSGISMANLHGLK